MHGCSLMHNHGHWMFEASTDSRYLNKKYKDAPELLVGPLDLPAAILSKYSGRVLSTGRPGLMRCIWTSVAFGSSCGISRIIRRGRGWCDGLGRGNGRARRHSFGESQAVWENVFERPETVAADWAEYLVGLEVERRLNAARLRTYNRPADCWTADDGERVGLAGGRGLVNRIV